jgi:hypothetical protein
MEMNRSPGGARLASSSSCGRRAEAATYSSTIDADAKPHLAGVVGHWLDDRLYFVSGPATRKARNMTPITAASFANLLPELDLVLSGAAIRATDPETLAQIAARYTERAGRSRSSGISSAQPFWAPPAPLPRWHVHASARTALGIAIASLSGATRWRFRV